ncbi:class I SAM-dependent methyltransferase [Nanoarchaeota archaeon]
MKNKFLEIKKEFDDFDSSLLADFRMVVRDTAKGIWGPANLEICYKLFKKIGLSKVGSFLDLGSGDGRVVLVASLFTEATGIEFDKDLVDMGIKIRDKLGLKADLIKGDFFEYDFSKYDVIFINPDNGFHKGLEDKLLKEMRPDARLYLYNNIFLPRFLKKGKTYRLGLSPVIVYRNKD